MTFINANYFMGCSDYTSLVHCFKDIIAEAHGGYCYYYFYLIILNNCYFLFYFYYYLKDDHINSN